INLPMKKITNFFLIAFCLLLLGGCSLSVGKKADQTDNWNAIQKRGTVTIGLDDTFVPMGFRQKNGQLAGYDIDLATAVFKLYGIKPSFQTIDWSMNATELKNGTIDLIWNGFTKTPEREAKVAFRSEEHTSELQSRFDLVCRLLLEIICRL